MDTIYGETYARHHLHLLKGNIPNWMKRSTCDSMCSYLDRTVYDQDIPHWKLLPIRPLSNHRLLATPHYDFVLFHLPDQMPLHHVFLWVVWRWKESHSQHNVYWLRHNKILLDSSVIHQNNTYPTKELIRISMIKVHSKHKMQLQCPQIIRQLAKVLSICRQ